MTTATATITHYRNHDTGELAPPHVLGTDEDGAILYLGINGWSPVDRHGDPVDVECDADGNWTVAATDAAE